MEFGIKFDDKDKCMEIMVDDDEFSSVDLLSLSAPSIYTFRSTANGRVFTQSAKRQATQPHLLR